MKSIQDEHNGVFIGNFEHKVNLLAINEIWKSESIHHSKPKVVGNKAKVQISKRVFQETKARQNFRKTNISYALIRTRACEIRTRFEIRPFVLLPTK